MPGRANPPTSLLRKVITQLRGRANRRTLADSTGASLTGREVLIRSLVLRRLLRRVLRPDEQRVGIMLPPTVAGAVSNLALALDRRVTVNLNYSLTPELVRYSLSEAKLHHVITSRAFLERMPVDLGDAKLIVLEELAKTVTALDKVVAAVQAYLPLPLLEQLLGIQDIPDDSLMTIIFTSGSTGRPKGVMLSWRNIQANTEMINALLRLRPDDVMIGVLPFFHSFGFTVTLWTPLAMGIGAVYHTNPLEGRVIGRLIREHDVTILLATPTFLRAYTQRLSPEDFASIELVASGSERLPQAVADAFEAKFGVRPFQGYGATEMGPIVSCNVPTSRALDGTTSGLREGTVGRPAKWVQVEARDAATGDVVGPGERGALWAKSPGLMLGYLNHPEQTAAVVQDGWYNLGDIVEIDTDGFISIVGRASRFAKVAGEQIPFAAVEEALLPLAGVTDEGVPRAVVTAVPNEATGERLVVVHTPLATSPAEVVKGLVASGLPRLFIPAPADFYEIAEMPLIGIGKVDLVKIDAIAREYAARRQAAPR